MPPRNFRPGIVTPLSGPADWRPSCAPEALRLRAGLLARMRAFFEARGVLEVDTPALSRAAVTDPALASFAVDWHGPEPGRLWLQTSPEYAMKRLLAAGSGPIWQLAKVFRDGEAGRRHNPEFSLLEWYRPGFDHHALMDEVIDLVSELLAGRRALAEPERIRYQDAFLQHAGVDPFAADVPALRVACTRHALVPPPGMPEAQVEPWLDLLLSHVIEPRLGCGRLSFLYDYPPAQAALACIRRDETPAVGSRFELYLDGVELANGFHELGDAGEQRARFEADNRARVRAALPVMPIDEALLAALASGLPACAGVALGFDRLLMLAANAGGLDAVLAFPVDRA